MQHSQAKPIQLTQKNSIEHFAINEGEKTSTLFLSLLFLITHNFLGQKRLLF